jgi:hypothetical protein
MKKLFFTTVMLFSATMFAQTISKSKKVVIPIQIETAFEKEYPKIKAEWDTENADFEAEFKINGKDASALYDKNGHKKAFEIDVKMSEIPVNALAYLKENYPNNKVSESAKITDDNKVITFEVEIKKNKKSFDLLFDADGKFIKTAEVD